MATLLIELHGRVLEFWADCDADYQVRTMQTPCDQIHERGIIHTYIYQRRTGREQPSVRIYNNKAMINNGATPHRRTHLL